MSKATVGTTEVTSPEAWWSVERIRGRKGLVSGRGRHGINISYDCLVHVGSLTLAVAEADEIRRVCANCSGGNEDRIKDKRLS